MSNDKHIKVLWTAAAAAVFAWPFGDLMGLVLSAGQDGPGRALVQEFASIVTFVVWAISTVVIIWNPGKGLKRLRSGARTIVALSILFLPAVKILSAVNSQDYDLRVWNETGARINDVAVRMVGKRYSFGVVSKGLGATIAFQQDRPEDSAEVSWTSGDGEIHVAEVDLSNMIPRRYNKGVLTFTIQPEDSVKADFFIQQEPAF